MSVTSASNHIGLPTPRRWIQRASAMPWVPGSVGEIVDNLCVLLASIKQDPGLDRPFTWPSSGDVTTLREAVTPLGTSGLLARHSRGFAVNLTPEAEGFLESRSTDYLIGLFHSRIRFVGEALLLLEHPVSSAELNQSADELYGLVWATLDQVSRRTRWFRAAGLLDLWTGSNQLVLTDHGQVFCDWLSITEPYEVPGRRKAIVADAILPGPGPVLSEEIARMSQGRLQARRAPIGYIAGGYSQESIRTLLNLASPEIGRDEFVAACMEQSNLVESSAHQSLMTLRTLGLVQQIGVSTFAPTELGQEWLATDYAVDLIRIIHSKILLIGEVIAGVAHEAGSGPLHHWLADAYPGIPITRAELAKRLALLQDGGLIESIGYARHQVTQLGKAFLGAVPILEPEAAAPVPEAGDVGGMAEDPCGDRLADQAQELLEASTDSLNPIRFERALEVVFRTLGIGVKHVGGSGNPDLCLTFWISPTERRNVTVEAKTNGSGVVPEKEFKPHILEGHRKKSSAERVIFVGPGFSGRIPIWAADEGIVLLSARQIAEMLIKVSGVGLLPSGIFHLIFAGVADEVQGSSEAVWVDAERALEAVHRAARDLWAAGNDEKDIEYTGGALTARDIWLMQKERASVHLDKAELQSALEFLSSPLVSGAVRGASGSFVAAAPPQLVAARLRVLADVIENGSPKARLIIQTPKTRQISGQSRRVETKAGNRPVLASQIRAWARENGRRVSASGRLPSSLVADFMASAADTPQYRPADGRPGHRDDEA